MHYCCHDKRKRKNFFDQSKDWHKIDAHADKER